MTFVLVTLIVYGITLVIVQGKIFHPVKSYIKKMADNSSDFFNITDEKLHECIETASDNIPQKLLDIHSKVFNEIKVTDPNADTFDKLNSVWNTCRETIKRHIEKHRIRKNKIKFTLFKSSDFIYNMTSCMMCTGFWVGIVISFLFAIPLLMALFGLQSILLITILGGFLFSGTTWIIHIIVDLLDELKEMVKRK